jgi:hypothetical protein
MAVMRCKNTFPYARSLSRIRNVGAVFQGNASMICWANHSAVGWRVTSNQISRRRKTERITEARECAPGAREAPGGRPGRPGPRRALARVPFPARGAAPLRSGPYEKTDRKAARRLNHRLRCDAGRRALSLKA